MNEITSNTVDILAEVSEYRAESSFCFGSPDTIRSLAQFAGNGGSPRIGVQAERDALVRLAAQCVARIEHLDAKENS